MLDRLTSTLDFHGQALRLRAERQQLIAGNIANADTPGYQAREMDFSAALRDATRHLGLSSSGGPSIARVPMAATQPGHVGAAAGGASLHRDLLYAMPSQPNLDRNTVDMDRERAAFADNSVKFEASLRFINGSVRTMLDAIRGGQ
ncbi:MAG: flagellar basal body rod protein FlgB [Ideonella sp.]|nr:flagellar basal body rod protein FlgB [Ideonella sp.]